MKVKTVNRGNSKSSQSFYTLYRNEPSDNPIPSEEVENMSERFLADSRPSSNNKHKNFPSSMPTSTTGSVYGGNNDASEIGEEQFVKDKELPIEELQKQHDELIRMQQMIQAKMSTIQNAIHKRESRENRALRPRSKPWKSTHRISTAFANSDTN